jgi:hypothetical protein
MRDGAFTARKRSQRSGHEGISMSGEFVVYIDAGTGTRGEWCDTCLTPGIFTIPLNRLHDDGVSTIGEIRRCTTCIPWEDDE